MESGDVQKEFIYVCGGGNVDFIYLRSRVIILLYSFNCYFVIHRAMVMYIIIMVFENYNNYCISPL